MMVFNRVFSPGWSSVNDKSRLAIVKIGSMLVVGTYSSVVRDCEDDGYGQVRHLAMKPSRPMSGVVFTTQQFDRSTQKHLTSLTG